jgi:hypothetical protein
MEEQQYQEGVAPTEARSSLAKVLLGKVVSHKLFSDRVLFWINAFLILLFFHNENWMIIMYKNSSSKEFMY